MVGEIKIENVSKSFTNPDGSVVNALNGVNLDIEPGSFISLIGPSGCGKTTLLRAIAGLGLAVFTEDSIAHLGKIERPLRIIDQWVYHNRLYRAAQFVSEMPSLELVQLTSFGCGLDAVTADQVDEILRAKSRMYTLIKIDEGSNLGAVRIRIRSLIAAVKERRRNKRKVEIKSSAYNRVVFTEEMKKDYNITKIDKYYQKNNE